MEETYRKVFIKTEADLPEKRGHYIAQSKDDFVSSKWFEPLLDPIKDYDSSKKDWLQNIDWYLQPVTAKTEQEMPMDYLFSYNEAYARRPQYILIRANSEEEAVEKLKATTDHQEFGYPVQYTRLLNWQNLTIE